MRGDKSLSTSPATAGVVCATVAAGFVHQTDLLQLLWPRRTPPCQQRGFSPRGCGNARHCLRRFCVTTTLAYPNLRLHWGVLVSWPLGLVTLYPVKRFLGLVLLPSPVTNSMRLIRGQKLIIYLWTNMVKSATCQPVLVENTWHWLVPGKEYQLHSGLILDTLHGLLWCDQHLSPGHKLAACMVIILQLSMCCMHSFLKICPFNLKEYVSA